jgi:hypothetical protein
MSFDIFVDRWQNLRNLLLKNFQYLNEALARLRVTSLATLTRQLEIRYSGKNVMFKKVNTNDP